MGGLGNQMFQYAAAAGLAAKHGTEVGLDMIFFEDIAAGDTSRQYELDCFGLDTYAGVLITPGKRPVEDPASEYAGRRGRLRKISHLMLGHRWGIYREPYHNFDPEMLKQPVQTYLIGYWQTEKYFKHIRQDLLEDFEFILKPTGKNKEHLKRIENSEAVSIHVRRGDYVTNESANKFHGTKDLAYYQAALKPVLRKTRKPVLFVFSDDPEWCKQNLKFSQETVYVEGNKKGFEDMRLMSRCKHNVLANSSFSWWAAWLNLNSDKVVVAPKQWFNDPSINISDVIPETWLKI